MERFFASTTRLTRKMYGSLRSWKSATTVMNTTTVTAITTVTNTG